MATVNPTNPTKGVFSFAMTNVNDETARIHLKQGQTVGIHVTGLTANTSTVQILNYVGDNTTAAPASFNGNTSFTSDFSLGFTAPSNLSLTVKLTADGGGTTTATITKE